MTLAFQGRQHMLGLAPGRASIRSQGVHSTVACAARKQRKKGKSKGRQKDQAPEAAANGASRSSVADATATASAASESQDGKAPSNGASAMPATAAGTAGSHTDASVSADPAAAANAASSTNGAATDTASAKGAAESSTRATTADGSTGAASSTDATSTSAAAVGESNAITTASPTDSSSGASASSNGGGGGFVPLRRPEEAQRRYEERSRSQKAASTSAASVQDASASAQDMQPPVTMAREKRKSQSTITAISRDKGGGGSLLPQQLLQKVGLLVAFVAASRVGVYARLPGIDIEQYSEAVARSSILGWVDNVTGGSLSNVGVFTLGIIPAINASIFLQLLTISFPSLKKLQREEGPSGRARYQLYQKLATLAFAAAQSFGQLTTLKNYASDPSPQWFLSNSFALVAGAMIVNQLADYITELKLGNGTSVLIFASIASFLPTSIGSAFQQAGQSGSSGVAIYFISFLLTTFGVVVAQTAERRVPINTASRYNVGALSRQNYFPFKVNGTGVMPVIFASSVIGVPPFLAKIAGADSNSGIVQQLQPSGALYLPLLVTLIVVINYFYTFIQFEPNDIAENLKKGQSSIPGVRPGKNTAQYITDRLTNMAVLGSIFLGVLSCAPVVTEKLTGVSALRGFAGTSVLIVVGVATELARRIRAEKQMSKYGNIDDLYDKL